MTNAQRVRFEDTENEVNISLWTAVEYLARPYTPSNQVDRMVTAADKKLRPKLERFD